MQWSASGNSVHAKEILHITDSYYYQGFTMLSFIPLPSMACVCAASCNTSAYKSKASQLQDL